MAFTLHVGAEVRGQKDNLELVFPGKPPLAEVAHRIRSTLSAETGTHFNVDQVRIYDEVLGRWVDLVQDEQLHSFAQLYAFQPDSAYSQDLRGLLPNPRPVGGQPLMNRPPPQSMQQPGGFGNPYGTEQGKEQARHVQIAQHLNNQLTGQGYGSPQPHPQPHPVQQVTYNHIDPRQAEIDAQKEQERHRLIAQHLNGQLSGGTGSMSPQYVNSPSQHSPVQTMGGPRFAAVAATPPPPLPPMQMQHHPAPSPMNPSPVTFMPSPATVQYPAANSPATPSGQLNPRVAVGDLPGVDPMQSRIDQEKEQERHRLIAQHLNNQLSGVSGTPGPRPASPVAQSPMLAHAPHNSPVTPTGPQFAPHPQAGVPGIDPQQAEIDARREQERHRLIAQHLNSQLSGQSPSGPPPQVSSPPQVSYQQEVRHPSPMQMRPSPTQMSYQQEVRHPSPEPPRDMATGVVTEATLHQFIDPMQAEIDRKKEEERHRLIAQHLNNQLSGRAGSQDMSGGHHPSPEQARQQMAFPPQGSPQMQQTTHTHTTTSHHHMGPGPYGQAPDYAGYPGPSQEAAKEQERHTLIAQHLNNTLQGRQ